MRVAIDGLLHYYSDASAGPGAFKLRIEHLELRSGEVFCLMGPNGAGKSTLVGLLGLVLSPRKGEISYDGLVPRRSFEKVLMRRKMGIVFQRDVFFNSSVHANIAYPLLVRRVPKHEIKRRVQDVLELFDLAPFASKKPHELSLGQRRRVSLARAIVSNPEMLLLDEPFGLLDPVFRRRVLPMFRKAAQATGATILLVTQSKSDALQVADRIGLIESGELRYVGLRDDLMRGSVPPELKKFFGEENMLFARVTASSRGVSVAEVNGAKIYFSSDVCLAKDVVLSISPEDIVLAKDVCIERQSAMNVLACEVKEIASSGAVAKVVLDCGFELQASVTTLSVERLGLRPGDRIFAIFKATAVRLA